MEDNKHIPISDWSIEDRPREKLVIKGRESLSESELLAILIGSGSNKESAVQLCRRILNDVGNNLNSLARLDIADLIKYKGIGEAKAISIIAALEIGRRRQLSEPAKRAQISSSLEAYKVIGPQLRDLPYEEFWLLLLSSSNKLIKRILISQGGVTATVVDSKIIWKHAVESLASSMILVHNHPSGNLKPSRQDIDLTNKIAEASKFMDIRVNDHIIIGEDSYFSFADEGLL